eukprot:GHVS01082184.1.p2 GENE.GHVS01082184.1~~GHVS01082184.1.p2  ORF type:complete len:121 (-),score=17.02 GHVS01082184.1:1379-1741(-)
MEVKHSVKNGGAVVLYCLLLLLRAVLLLAGVDKFAAAVPAAAQSQHRRSSLPIIALALAESHNLEQGKIFTKMNISLVHFIFIPLTLLPWAIEEVVFSLDHFLLKMPKNLLPMKIKPPLK